MLPIQTSSINPTLSTACADIRRLALVAGEGDLPIIAAQQALAEKIPLNAYALDAKAADALEALLKKPVYRAIPGLMRQNIEQLQSDGISHLIFVGKVNKWVLLRNPQLDSLAMSWLSRLGVRNDDGLMHGVIAMFESYGIQILPQTAFLKALFQPPGVLGVHSPSPKTWQDIAYGYHLAREMGRLDVGQSVVVQDGYLLAVEAIEGTDQCIKRAGKLSQKLGAVLVKVAKPNQDNRFDVPTVGLRTLKIMQKAGLRTLAFEARETLCLDLPEMLAFANTHGMSVVSVNAQNLPAIALPWHMSAVGTSLI